MNKQLTKKTIGIAASAALMASLAFSGNAFAEKGGKSQSSLGVASWCKIPDPSNGLMDVYFSIVDKSSGKAYRTAMLDSVTIKGQTKDGGPTWDYIPGALKAEGARGVADDNPTTIYINEEGGFQKVSINVCGDPANLGRAINAETVVTLLQQPYPSSQSEYSAQCGDDPGTDEIEGGLKTADFAGLCE